MMNEHCQHPMSDGLTCSRDTSGGSTLCEQHLRCQQPMIHLFTKVRWADYIWIIGMRCALSHAGGGKLTKTARGIEVWALDPSRLNRTLGSLAYANTLEEVAP